MAEYEAKLAERADKTEQTGKKPGGKPPAAPTPGARDKDQYNFTDPESRIMKNCRDAGFGQYYNAQAGVDECSRLIVGDSLSNHTNDQYELVPTLDTVPAALGPIPAAATDTGYFSETNVNALESRGIEPYIATGRTEHHGGWRAYFEEAGEAPPENASVREKMAYKLRTEVGKAIYRRRKCTVEPVIGKSRRDLGSTGSDGVPSILVTGSGSGPRGMESGVCGVQSASVACVAGCLMGWIGAPRRFEKPSS